MKNEDDSRVHNAASGGTVVRALSACTISSQAVSINCNVEIPTSLVWFCVVVVVVVVVLC